MGVSLSGINISCNFYNVNQYNKKVTIVETKGPFIIIIPQGYYGLDDLLTTISIKINECSPSKQKYILQRSKHQNRVHITCHTIDDVPSMFNITFVTLDDKAKEYATSLNQLLGFQSHEYNGNNIYMAENAPIEDPFDKIYLKFFINDKEIRKVCTSLTAFGYFTSINTNINQNFTKKVSFESIEDDMYEFNETTHVNKIDFELWSSTLHKIPFRTCVDITLRLYVA
jgi:hypothetical protein